MSNISEQFRLACNVVSLNSPKKWINFQSEVGSQTVTNARLLSFGPSNVRNFSLEGTKRKRKAIDGDPVLQCSSNPPESSRRNCSTLSMVVSPHVADDELSVNQDIEDPHIPKTHAVSEPSVNLELTLSVGPAKSTITSEVGTPAPGFFRAHGGRQRCENSTMHFQLLGIGRHLEQLDITKISEVSSKFCIARNVGRRCRKSGCTTVSRGKSGFCIKHGGGRRCIKKECNKGAAGGSGLCIAHGGGRRCYKPECTKGAQGRTMFCKAHGGGKRCIIPCCGKGAEGSTPFCKRHGGGKRCLFEGGNRCSKSVRGGSKFCVAHGGGKRCAYPECLKSARGRTDYCVRHGGGRRCRFEGCDKSAQGSTDFCKFHGGGKRCSWIGQAGSVILCNRVSSSGEVGLCAAHGALVKDLRVHGGETMDPIIYGGDSLTEGRVHGGSLMEFLAKGVQLDQYENLQHL